MSYILESNEFLGNEEMVLPDYSIDILDKLERVDKINMSENKLQSEKVKELYKFECDILGKEKAEELVGGDLKHCDPNKIKVLLILIIRAYDKPIDDIQAEEEEGALEQLEQVGKYAEEMNKVPDTYGKVNRMKK